MNDKAKLKQLEEKLDNHMRYNKNTENYERIIGFLELQIENLKDKIIKRKEEEASKN